jgi:glycosyltransferase involved in cell wall biosynthesis
MIRSQNQVCFAPPTKLILFAHEYWRDAVPKCCVHIVESADPKCTGIGKIILGLAQHSASSQYRLSALFFEDGPLRAEFESRGILTAMARWNGTYKDFLGASRALRWIRQHKVQIVHIHHGGFAVRLLSRMAGALVVQHVHSEVFEPDLSPNSTSSFRCVDAVVANSQAVADPIRNANAEVIYAGLDTSSDPPIPPAPGGPFRIGVLARLVPLKRIETVIEAHAKLTSMGLQIETDICGEGPSETALRRLAEDLGVGESVRFLGWRQDAPALLKKWHLLAMPSMHEGFGIAGREAMAAGRAVVASRVGGVPELVEDGVSGILIPAADTDALVQSIWSLSVDRPKLNKMGYEGWKRANRLFSSQRMAEQTFALYDRLLTRSSR